MRCDGKGSLPSASSEAAAAVSVGGSTMQRANRVGCSRNGPCSNRKNRDLAGALSSRDQWHMVGAQTRRTTPALQAKQAALNTR